MVITYISTGSNIGDRYEALIKAREMLNNKAGIVTIHSSIYESEPWGFDAETHFLNQVLVIQTMLQPLRLMKVILDIEKQMGRKRNHLRYEPRIIDIDILLYGRDIIKKHNLQIPHPRMQHRKFVLVPLSEIAPDMVHPVSKLRIAELLDQVKDECKIKLWKSAADISLEASGKHIRDIS